MIKTVTVQNHSVSPVTKKLLSHPAKETVEFFVQAFFHLAQGDCDFIIFFIHHDVDAPHILIQDLYPQVKAVVRLRIRSCIYLLSVHAFV